jgi:DNA-3-methyladenine glycosylase
MSVIPAAFFLQTDVVSLANQLIGCRLNTIIDGKFCSGTVIETEAYAGETDKASHAFGGRKSARTSIMYKEGGIAYVYFCYGMHYLFNVVTAVEGVPHAILIRALLPVEGIETMQYRRGSKVKFSQLTNGPGKLTKAMGIGKSHNGLTLERGHIWFEETSEKRKGEIVATPRIGIDYAEEDALLPYRFVWTPSKSHKEKLI